MQILISAYKPGQFAKTQRSVIRKFPLFQIPQEWALDDALTELRDRVAHYPDEKSPPEQLSKSPTVVRVNIDREPGDRFFQRDIPFGFAEEFGFFPSKLDPDAARKIADEVLRYHIDSGLQTEAEAARQAQAAGVTKVPPQGKKVVNMQGNGKA